MEKARRGFGAGREALAEIETDKAIMDLEAFASGILRKILVQDGATVMSGTLIGVIGGADEDITSALTDTDHCRAIGRRRNESKLRLLLPVRHPPHPRSPQELVSSPRPARKRLLPTRESISPPSPEPVPADESWKKMS